jgi:hypothetical protein
VTYWQSDGKECYTWDHGSFVCNQVLILTLFEVRQGWMRMSELNYWWTVKKIFELVSYKWFYFFSANNGYEKE